MHENATRTLVGHTAQAARKKPRQRLQEQRERVGCVDSAEESEKTRARYSIPFPVLSDPELTAHRAFRVIHQADEAEVKRLKGFGMDLERASGKDHHFIAIPSIFLIDEHGVVRWAHADPDYKVRPSIVQILAAIDALKPASP